MRLMVSATVSPKKQLQRTVTRRRGDGASAPFHYALRFIRQRAAAELRRQATVFFGYNVLPQLAVFRKGSPCSSA
jgi:hypothetical protein